MALDQKQLELFQEQKKRLGSMLSDSADVISELNMTSASENLNKLSDKVNNDTFKIQVVGTFSNGKSSVINALLGENVLPAYALPTTAVINEVKYGEKNPNIIIYDKAVNVGENINAETEYLGVVSGRLIKQSFNLNGNIIIKEAVLK